MFKWIIKEIGLYIHPNQLRYNSRISVMNIKKIMPIKQKFAINVHKDSKIHSVLYLII